MNLPRTIHQLLALSFLTASGTYALPLLAEGDHQDHGQKEFRILHHERMKAIRFSYRSAAKTSREQGEESTPPANVSFNAYDRQFQMDLETNEHLLDNLPTDQKKRLKQSIKLYKGRLNGMAGSWVRVNRVGNRLTGALWDGRDLYIIDNSDKVSKSLTDNRAAASARPYNLVYKVADTETNAQCALEAPQNASNMSSLISELQIKAQALAQANKKLDVAIVTDAQFTQANSSNPQAAVMARMNVVDGIYSEQVGVHLNIAEIRALSSNGVLTSTVPGTLVDQFASYTTSSGFNNPGIAHLFTGRDLDGSTVGIAYIGVLCNKNIGVGLSQTDGQGIAGALTVAHEMGHNFGAPHDGQSGSACASAPNTFIMNSILNGSTQFSDCSLQQMATNVSTAACLTNITPSSSYADLRAAIPVNPISAPVNTNFNASVEVKNVGTTAALSSLAKITLPAGLVVNQVKSTLGQCQTNAQVVTCNLGSVPVNNTATISLNLKAGNVPGTTEGKIQVSASNDKNTANNAASVAFNTTSLPAPTPPSSSIFQSNFNADNGGFSYLDDAFLSSNQAAYESGNRTVVAGDGKLAVVLGGLDDRVIKGMSGGFRRTFTLAKPQSVTLSFEYRIDQTAYYEPNEWTDALLALDGQVIGLNGANYLSRVFGNGEDGVPLTSGLIKASITRGPLAAGTHTITLGGYNNQKTSSKESSRVYFDNVKLVTKP